MSVPHSLLWDRSQATPAEVIQPESVIYSLLWDRLSCHHSVGARVACPDRGVVGVLIRCAHSEPDLPDHVIVEV